MKKIYFIFPILFCFMFLFLPQIKEPVLAEGDSVEPIYNEIEITTDFNDKDLMSIHTDGDNLYFTNGKKIVRKNILSKDELLMFSRSEGNDYYSLFANDDNLYFAQENSKAYFINKTINTLQQNYTSIDNYNYKTKNDQDQIINNQVGILNDIKGITADANNYAYLIFKNYIGKVTKHTIENDSTTYELDQVVYPIEQDFSGGGFAVNEDGTEFYYSVGSTIYKITLTQQTTINPETNESVSNLVTTQTQLTIQGEQIASTITHISVDCLGNLFVLENNTIHKLTPNGDTYLNESKTFDFVVVDVSFDFCTGKTYAIVNVEEEVVEEPSESGDEGDDPQSDEQNQNEPTTQSVNKLVSLNLDFVTNYTQLEAENYQNFSNAEAQDSVVKLLNLKADTPIYAYQSLKTFKSKTTDSKTVIKLGEATKFYYVLDTNSEIEPFFQLCYIPKTFSTKEEVEGTMQTVTKVITDDDFIEPRITSITECKVMVANIKLYNYPLSVILEKVEKQITYAPNSGKVSRDSFISVCNIDTKLPVDSNNTPFVLVKFTNDNQTLFAYVDSRTIINKSDDNSLKMIPVSNARLRETTFIFADEKLTEKQDELVEGANVTVLHKSGGVARVQYYVGNELKMGYVDKNLVDDGSLATMQMIGLGVASTCVVLSIILTIVISKKRKKQKYQA